MTRNEAIAELVRIWHSPHLDLSLKAGLAEAIETLKEKNQSDSLVTDSSDACKESKSKLDLISRQDAIEAIEEIAWYHQNRNREMVSGANSDEDQAWYKAQDIYTALEALPSAEAIHKPDYSYEAGMVRRLKEALSAEAVQGEWIDIDSYYRMATCSHCLKVTMFEKWGEYIRPYNFCPNCGARMNGGEEE